MRRSAYRNIMLTILSVLLGLSAFIFTRGQNAEQDILNNQNQLTKLKQELENAARLSAALTELDQLTINEQTATQLDILRHLGLEQTDISFSIESREVRAVGQTNLYVRTVRVEGPLSYPAALYLADQLHNTKKIVMTELQLEPVAGKRDKVRLRLVGKVYGLDKNTLGPAK